MISLQIKQMLEKLMVGIHSIDVISYDNKINEDSLDCAIDDIKEKVSVLDLLLSMVNTDIDRLAILTAQYGLKTLQLELTDLKLQVTKGILRYHGILDDDDES